MEDVTLGPKVVVTFRDKHGVGASLFHALDKDRSSSSSSSWTCVAKTLHLPLLSGGSALVEVVSFVDARGPQVSLILLQESTKPANVYASHAVLNFVMERAPVQLPDFLVIFASVAVVPYSFGGDRSSWLTNEEWGSKSLYAAFINTTLELQQGLFKDLPRLPPDMQIEDETLAALVHFARIQGAPTALLIVPVVKINPLDYAIQNQRCQIAQNLGDFLTKQLGLSFIKSEANGSSGTFPLSESGENDDWRRLYI